MKNKYAVATGWKKTELDKMTLEIKLDIIEAISPAEALGLATDKHCKDMKEFGLSLYTTKKIENNE